MKPAAFLDRDGTIIEDRGHLRSPAEVVFYPETVRALQRLQEHFDLFIVTHQPGIAGGLVSEAEVEEVNRHVATELLRQGVRIAAVYCCPHRREDRCRCIKPEPFFLEEAARQFGVDLKASFVVGDHPHDVTLAQNAGARGVYVLTGHGRKHRAEAPAGAPIVPGIWEAVDWILAFRHMRQLEEKAPGLLDEAARAMRASGIVAFPTETVYGLGAVVFDERAVARVFEAKNRPYFDPLIVHVSTVAQLAELVTTIPKAAQELIGQFWPGPLTVVVPKSSRVSDLVTAGLPTVAVRMPRHPLALALITRVGAPIAAPSANVFGHCSPTTAEHVRATLESKVDFILDGGPCAIGVESTIVSFADAEPVLLRSGGVPAEDIERLIGPLKRSPGSGTTAGMEAPGMLPRHYSPRTPLRLRPAGAPLRRPRASTRTGLLAFRPVADMDGFAAVEILSRDGDLREAAANLFSALRRLDEQHLDEIWASPAPSEGLGLAINDRLARAAGVCVTEQPQP